MTRASDVIAVFEQAFRELVQDNAPIESIPFTRLGIDSVSLSALHAELEDLIGQDLPSTMLYRCKSAHEVVHFLEQKGFVQ